MSAEKTAGVFGPSSGETEAALQRFYGDRLLNSAGAGAGMGMGAAALYHLLRGAKPKGKKEKKYPAYGSGSPMVAKQAALVGQSLIPNHFGAPGGGITQAASNKPTGTAPPSALSTFAQQNAHMFGGDARAAQSRLNELHAQGFFNAKGTAKTAFDINSLKQMLGGAVPTTMLPFSAPALGSSGAPSADPHAWRKSWSTAANIAGAGAGAAGGGYLINALVKHKKKRDQAAALDAARQEYYGALSGGKHANWLPNAVSPGILGGAASGALGGAALGAYKAPKGQKWQGAQRGALIGGGLSGGVHAVLHGMVRVRPRVPPVPVKIAEMEAAQADYHAALLGGKHAALDTAFEAVKSANLLTDAVSGAYNTPQTLRTAYLLSMLGVGGMGAKYMYDRTKQMTTGENLAKAQASRARTRGLPPIYVDPDGLAKIKADAENNG
jgi:hypothetical protein